jgi:cellulose synthase/poly-beta-1,6-N-acetylglucosamine synthase-like glycosyltransferase
MPPWAETAALTTAQSLVWLVIASGLLQVAVYFLQLILAANSLLRRPPLGRFNLLWRRYSELAPPISLLVPAYNEEMTIVESLKALLSMEYPAFEVIVINDGSRDNTLRVVIEAFGLQPTTRLHDASVPHKTIRGLYASARYPRLLVADKENGGKADAQNAGIDLCRAPLFCVIDGDSLLEPDALLRAVRPFIDDPARTVAVGGTIRIANGCRIASGRVAEIRLPRNFLALMQIVEYLRAFLMARLAWSRIDTLMLISGAFGIFRRAEAAEVGGFSLGTVGEDLDMIIKLHRHLRDGGRDYRIAFVPEPVCWTEAPENAADLGRQRARWQRGALEAFFKYRGMLFRPRYGRIGTLGLGHIMLVDVIGPPVEALGYILLPIMWWQGLIDFDLMLAFLALTFTYGVFISVGSLILEELELRRFPRAWHLMVLTLVAVLENFGYRQINSFWRLRGWWQFLRREQGWGKMTRAGFSRT